MKKDKDTVLSTIINVILIIIFAFPIFWMFSASLQTLAEIMRTPPTILPSSPQWSNFTEALNSGPFATYTKNSIISTFASMILQLLTVVPAAYAYARLEFKGKSIFWALTLICLMIPMQLIFLPNYIGFSRVNLLNTIWPLILPFGSSAFGIFMLRQSFLQIPEEIVEAARLDNATEGQIIRKIFIPMAIPTIVTMLLFTFIGRWNDYFWPLVMTTVEEARTLPVGVAMLKMTDGAIPWNIVMASNVLLIAPIILIYIFAQDKIVKAFTYTGVK